MNGRVCPYCGEKTKLVDSAVIYGTSYGMIYLCAPCDAYVGVHSGTTRALGRLANAELREWKKNAHAHFDPIWQDRLVTKLIRNMNAPGRVLRMNVRQQAYWWLSKVTGIPEKRCHIGMMDVDQCKKVVIECRKALLRK